MVNFLTMKLPVSRNETGKEVNLSKKPKIRGFGWSFNGMREQGSLKGEGTHRGNLCVYTQIVPNPDKLIVIYHDSKECEKSRQFNFFEFHEGNRNA